MIVEPVCKCFYASDARKKGTVDLHDQVKTLTSQAKRGDTEPCVVCEPSMCVRRLTPRECERLQGFPDHYTMIQWRKKPAGNCPDGPRYKALGNSMAVPVMHWIGKRIAEVEAHG
jgi:DNA (cytosine-5)-methyltransferase 1